MNMLEFGFQVLGQTQDHRHRVLVAAAKNIKVWFIKVKKIKAIYHTLNMFNLDVTQKCLIGECWCPVKDLDKIQMALRRGTVSYHPCYAIHPPPNLCTCHAGEKRQQCAEHPQPHADQDSAPDLPSHQQVHRCFPGHCGCVRSRLLPRSQPRFVISVFTPTSLHFISLLQFLCSSPIHHHQLPLPVCCDVRRCWPRCFGGSLRFMDGVERETIDGQQNGQRGSNYRPLAPSSVNYSPVIIIPGLEHLLRWTLHHPLDGSLFHIFWPHVQRYLLQVVEHLWIRMAGCQI